MEIYLDEIKASISEAVSKSVEGANDFGILFSGGLDSSLIAFLAKKHAENAEITLYTVGTADSQDIFFAKKASSLLGMEWKGIEVHPEKIIKCIPELAEIIDSHHPVKISFELPLYLGMINIDEKLILSGQGADELFGGYARYLKMEKKDLERALEKDVEELMRNGIKMDYRIADHFAKILKTPYLDENVIKRAMRIPIQYKVNNNQRKVILKQAALHLGLPSELVSKEKKAMQYSSGILKELRKTAKRKGKEVNELIEDLVRH